jgi:hypothetical protein
MGPLYLYIKYVEIMLKCLEFNLLLRIQFFQDMMLDVSSLPLEDDDTTFI